MSFSKALAQPAAIGETTGPAAAILQMDGEMPFPANASLFEIFFIDLTRDDGFLLRLNGQTLLIDGGHENRFIRLRNFLLQETGALAVDAILNTHQHDDHVTGEISLLKRGGSTQCFYGPLSPDTKDGYYQTLLPLLQKADTPYVQLKEGDTLVFGGGQAGEPPVLLQDDFAVQPENSARIQVYRCEENLAEINSSCLMLHITYGKRTLLLMADSAGRPQSYLLDVAGDSIQADIFKVAHHGLTPTVQSLLDAVSPSLGVITNARRATENQNRQFRLRGIPALYTAEGTIYMATDGDATWYVRQFPVLPDNLVPD